MNNQKNYKEMDQCFLIPQIHSDKPRIFQIDLINISYTLVNLDDYDGALYYFKKASEINEQDGRLKELKSLIEKNKATLKK